MLRPNRSCSWKANQLVIAVVAFQAILVGAYFWLQGLYLVLPFAGLELLAVAASLYQVSRRAYARETVLVEPNGVEVTAAAGRAERRWRFARHAVRLAMRESRGGGSRLSVAVQPKLGVEIGSFLSEGERRALHRSLQQALRMGV